jgi:D-glycero-alpha-D-manno-heptose-7-phosphate kinase
VLIARAPMRLSFAGGGTDLPAFCEEHGGMVVSMAIDKYVYVFISANGHDSLQISSSDFSTFFRHSGDGDVAEEGKLRYARAFVREFNIRSGYSVFMASEMPPGTGLGSSSALAVALTKALTALRGQVPEKASIAELAATVEMDRLQMPIGRQDHYAAAFGGLNAIHFERDSVRVEPLEVSVRTREWLDASVLIFFTEQSHDSREILEEQDKRSREHNPETIGALEAIWGHAHEAREALLEDRPEDLGPILHRTWLEKKKIAPGITNLGIDNAYQAGLAAGATGGKIAGAGGGGFLMLVCPGGTQLPVTSALETLGLTRADFHIDYAGARVLVNNGAA